MPRPDVSDERKTQILAAAAELFSRNGIHASSMTEIALSAKLSKAAVYHYYDSKDAMVEALVRQLFDSDQPDVRKLIESEEPALARLEKYLKGLVRLLEQHKALYPVLAEFKAVAARDQKVKNVLESCFMQRINAFKTAIQNGIDEGDIRDDVDAMEVAWALGSIIEGSITMRHATGRSLKKILLTNVKLFFDCIEK